MLMSFSVLCKNSPSNQTNWDETLRSDLEDIRGRLAVVEAAIEVTAKEGEKNTAEGKTTGRKRRPCTSF